jgi:hypothetical protein
LHLRSVGICFFLGGLPFFLAYFSVGFHFGQQFFMAGLSSTSFEDKNFRLIFEKGVLKDYSK